MSFIAVYITCKDQTEATHISDALLSKKLIACSNIFPIRSTYWWNENIMSEKEFVCFVKTASHLWDDIQTEVSIIHSYQTPCIMKFEVEANPKYEEWIHNSVRSE